MKSFLHNQHHLSQSLVKSHSPVEGIFSGIKDAKIPRQSCCNLIVTCTPKNYPMIAPGPFLEKEQQKLNFHALSLEKPTYKVACV